MIWSSPSVHRPYPLTANQNSLLSCLINADVVIACFSGQLRSTLYRVAGTLLMYVAGTWSMSTNFRV